MAYDAANRYRSPDREENLKSLFCLDPDTGVAYFVNQNRDWYIYRLINGKEELAVGLPARELYVVSGTVYFILEDYDQYELEEGLTEGDIYACTLADGSVKKVFSAEGLESEICRMRPYEDGIAIYCRVDTGEYIEKIFSGKQIECKKIEEYYYFYRFSTATLEEDPSKRVLPGWGEYYLMYDLTEEVWKTVLWSRKNHEKEKWDIEFPGYRSFIVEDKIYCFSGAKFRIIDILTGERAEYDIYAMFRELVPTHAARLDELDNLDNSTGNLWILNSLTVTRDYVWMSLFDCYVFRLDPVSGEAACYMLESQFGQVGRVGELYTDGINLYATYISSGDPEDYERRTPVRICTEKIVGQDKRTALPLLAVEHLTK